MWIFGYGSVMWNPGFPHRRVRVATVKGFARRLDQGSPDHRGTPERPGRVVTLVPDVSASCTGLAYHVDAEDPSAILAAMDHRERGGYVRRMLEVTARDDGERIPVTCWIGELDNPWYLGPAPLEAVVRMVRSGHGESGANADYVLRLRDTLRVHGITDVHVEEVATALERGDT